MLFKEKILLKTVICFFEPEHRYFELSGIYMDDVLSWRSTGLSDEEIKPTKVFLQNYLLRVKKYL